MLRVKSATIFRQLLPLTLAVLFATGGLLPAQTVPWTIVESPNPSQSSNYLKGVDALASTDAWAVGNYFNPALSRTQNLALHWNGNAWTVTPTPNLTSPYTNLLKKVAAVAPNDVWAVGGHGLSFTLHWDGAQWSQIPLPPINRTNFLDDIAAAAPNDIWLVGAMDALNGGTQTLTLHWNRTNWTQVPSPNQPMPSGGFLLAGTGCGNRDRGERCVGGRLLSRRQHRTPARRTLERHAMEHCAGAGRTGGGWLAARNRGGRA